MIAINLIGTVQIGSYYDCFDATFVSLVSLDTKNQKCSDGTVHLAGVF